MAERLSVEARMSALAQLTGWSDTPGREAIARPSFQGFQRSFLASCPASRWWLKERSPPGMAQCLQDGEVFWPPMTPRRSPPSISSLQRR